MWGYTPAELPFVDIVGRLGMAALLGALVGLDRELRRRPAGLRTHMMTSLAAAAMTLLALDLHTQFFEMENSTNVDPIRVVEAITAGVAFLAAGAIIRSQGEIHGLTTGANLWLAGGLGLACGAGRFDIAVVALVIALVVLTVLRPLEKRLGDLFARDRGDDAEG
jgi:putative Mg2+ transporter-C (MgtC) family protein